MAFDYNSTPRSNLHASVGTDAIADDVVVNAQAATKKGAEEGASWAEVLGNGATVAPLNGGRSLNPHPKKELFESTRHGTSVFPFASYLWVPQDFPSRVTLHWHRETELVRFTKGTFKVSIDMQDMVINDDAFLLLPGNVMHTITLPAYCEESAIVFDPKMLLLQSYDEVQSEIFEALLSGNMPLPLVITPAHPAFERIDQLYNYCAHHGATTHSSLRLKIKTKLLEILSIYHQYGLISRKDVPTNIKRSKQDKLKELLNYIDSHYAGPMSIKDASCRLGVTDQYFCRFFKRVTGMSFTEYLNDLRLRRAAKEIELTTRAISDIAYEHGFENAGYFFKSFKSKYGITPLKYRKRFRAEPNMTSADDERAITDANKKMAHQRQAQADAEFAAELAATASTGTANAKALTEGNNGTASAFTLSELQSSVRTGLDLPPPDFTLQNPLMPPLNAQEMSYLLKLAQLGLYSFSEDPDDNFEDISTNYGSSAARRAAAQQAHNSSQSQRSNAATHHSHHEAASASTIEDGATASALDRQSDAIVGISEHQTGYEGDGTHNNSLSISNGYSGRSLREFDRDTWTPSSGITPDYLHPVPNDVSINTGPLPLNTAAAPATADAAAPAALGTDYTQPEPPQSPELASAKLEDTKAEVDSTATSTGDAEPDAAATEQDTTAANPAPQSELTEDEEARERAFASAFMDADQRVSADHSKLTATINAATKLRARAKQRNAATAAMFNDPVQDTKAKAPSTSAKKAKNSSKKSKDKATAKACDATPDDAANAPLEDGQRLLSRRAEIRAKIDELETLKQFHDLDI